MLLRLAAIILLCLLALPAGICAEPLDNRSWSVTNAASLVKNPPTKEEVADFVFHQDKNYDPAPQGPQNLCSSAFVDLQGTGQYSLIASLDVNGRLFCNQIDVISKNANGFHVDVLQAWYVEDVGTIVQKLSQGKTSLLVLPQPISEYRGVECIALLDKIYKLKGRAMHDVSTHYPDYYRKKLSNLEADIKDNPMADDVSCKKITANRIRKNLKY